MNGPSRGFVLLTSHLGDPRRPVLSVAQLRTLAQRVRSRQTPELPGELDLQILLNMGYDRSFAERILFLLSQESLLDAYLQAGLRRGCRPLVRIDPMYPGLLRRRLGLDCPGCLWYQGPLSLLETPTVALVGSRELKPVNRAFAREVGRQAALQGFALVSGNARGSDQTAQEACLSAGGNVICVVADALDSHSPRKNVLYLSEDGFELAFSAQRALSRNRVIHSLGQYTFVAQCGLEKGGTWHGTNNNLRHGYSPVFSFQDGSAAAEALVHLGAEPIGMEELQSLRDLKGTYVSLFDTK